MSVRHWEQINASYKMGLMEEEMKILLEEFINIRKDDVLRIPEDFDMVEDHEKYDGVTWWDIRHSGLEPFMHDGLLFVPADDGQYGFYWIFR